MLKRLGNFETKGTYAFHSAQNSWSFRGSQMEWIILVWPGQNIKVVPFDCSCWLDWNVPFHFSNLLSPLLFFCMLITTWQYNNQMCGGFGRVCKTGVSVSLGTYNFGNFKLEYLLNGKCPRHSVLLVFICSILGWLDVLTLFQKILKNTLLKGIIIIVYLHIIIMSNYKVTPKCHLSIHLYLNVKQCISWLSFWGVSIIYCCSFFQDPHNPLQGWNLTPVLGGQPGQFPWILSRPGQQ